MEVKSTFLLYKHHWGGGGGGGGGGNSSPVHAVSVQGQPCSISFGFKLTFNPHKCQKEESDTVRCLFGSLAIDSPAKYNSSPVLLTSFPLF